VAAWQAVEGAAVANGLDEAPELKVDVARVGADVVISYGYCGGASGSTLSRIGVERRFDDGRRETYCDFKAKAGRIDVGGRWVYGSSVPGLDKLSCRPLVPGKYVAFVIASGEGERSFEVQKGGQIVQGKPSCPE
jgi:hypothetical protein